MTPPTEPQPARTPTAPEGQAVTVKRADELQTGDLLWLEETRQWHQVFVLPTQPVAVPIPGGFELSTNLHLHPNPKGPRSIATYTLPVRQMVVTATPPAPTRADHPRAGLHALAQEYRSSMSLNVVHAWAQDVVALLTGRSSPLAQGSTTSAPSVTLLQGALERIGWHDLTAREARDVARAALEAVHGDAP